MGSLLANLAMSTLMPTTSSSQTKSANAKANATTSANANSSTSSSSSDGGLGSTFLSLLSQELQNQDPTAPVDATAMVGQMISLNQLQQLIDINQSLTSSTSTSTSSTKAGSVQAAAASIDDANSTLSPSAASAASKQLPFDPSTMMPLGSGNSAALAASFNSSINAATLGLSGTSKYATGGK